MCVGGGKGLGCRCTFKCICNFEPSQLGPRGSLAHLDVGRSFETAAWPLCEQVCAPSDRCRAVRGSTTLRGSTPHSTTLRPTLLTGRLRWWTHRRTAASAWPLARTTRPWRPPWKKPVATRSWTSTMCSACGRHTSPGQ
jgi:hypothetical protein